MVSFTLKDAGFEVIEGGNGQEALDRLGSVPGGKVDLIITDLTPILMLTTESGDNRKAEGKAAGATGWIVKPFHPTQLLGVIGKVLP